MKTTLPTRIETKEQAIAFLTELHRNGEAFHPEDDATECGFSQEDGTKLNELMEQIYDLDGNNGNHKDPKFDPCEVLNILNAMDGAHNLELVQSLIKGEIVREVCYTYVVEKNNHTKNHELNINGLGGRTYQYSRKKDIYEDLDKLRGYEIFIEEEF